ncbi:hypothetical protein C8J57DRAFT_1224545 [Mycena rebaudengoi]|nr:hypothetical protein C8J57DRAFT_1224545 [Mycena rebaudengoi]
MSCQRCAPGIDYNSHSPSAPGPLLRSSTHSLHPGNIHAVHASLKLPFLEKLLESLPRGSKISAEVKSKRSFLAKLGDPKGKTRPCVVIGVKRSAGVEPKLCLMGTFDKCDPQSLPEMYKDFVVPLYPNLGESPGSETHLHSTPDWSHRSAHRQWIIALPVDRDTFSSSLPLWETPEMPEGVHFSEEMLTTLGSICVAKQMEWRKRSTDVQFLNRCTQQILEWRRCRASSMGSAKSYSTAPRSKISRRSESDEWRAPKTPSLKSRVSSTFRRNSQLASSKKSATLGPPYRHNTCPGSIYSVTTNFTGLQIIQKWIATPPMRPTSIPIGVGDE